MNPELKENKIYKVIPKKGKQEIALYRDNKFWFFGWEIPESPDKFKSWEECVINTK